MKRYLRYAKLALGILSGKRAFTGPLMVQIGLSNQCNYRCVMCWDHPPKRSEQSDYFPDATTKAYYQKNPDIDYCKAMMSWEVYKPLIDDLVKLQVEKIKFVGRGEPFLNPDSIEMIAYAAAKGFVCDISSNGYLLDQDKISKLIDAGVGHLQISLNAATPESYVKIHMNTTEKHFRKIIETLSYLKEQKEKNKKKLPVLQLSFVISKHNFRDVVAMVEIANQLGATSLAFRDLAIYKDIEDLALDEDDNKVLRELVKEAEKKAKEYKLINNFGIFISERDNKSSESNKMHWLYNKIACTAGWFYAVVLADGIVNPCCECLKKMGSLKEKSFYEIWHSKEYTSFRQQTKKLPKMKKMPEGCKCSVCGLSSYNISVDRLLYRKFSKAPKGHKTFSLKDSKYFYLED